MSALIRDREMLKQQGKQFVHPIAAGEVMYLGAMVFLNATGYAITGIAAVNLKIAGVAIQHKDNSSGLDGDLDIEIEKGVFSFDNAGDIDRSHIGTPCYALDDQTVSSDAAGKSVVGTIMQIDSDGVWVEVS